VLDRSESSQPHFGAIKHLGEKDETLHCCQADLSELNTRLKSKWLEEKIRQIIKWPVTDKEVYKVNGLNSYRNTITFVLLHDQT
jgi:hypothetical protein